MPLIQACRCFKHMNITPAFLKHFPKCSACKAVIAHLNRESDILVSYKNAAHAFGRGLQMHSDVTDGAAPDNDLIPTVSSVDVRNVWMMQRDTQKSFPGQQVWGASGTQERACSPGADSEAVYQRASLLYLLGSMDGPNPLAPWMHNGEPDDVVFKVFATFPMKRLPRDSNFGGLPFDFEELAKQLEKEPRENC
jgi:hypothetical protein